MSVNAVCIFMHKKNNLDPIFLSNHFLIVSKMFLKAKCKSMLFCSNFFKMIIWSNITYLNKIMIVRLI